MAEEFRLTKRQRECLERFIEGRPISTIAAEFHCSEATVRGHLQAVAEHVNSPHPPLRRLLIYGAELLAEGS